MNAKTGTNGQNRPTFKTPEQQLAAQHAELMALHAELGDAAVALAAREQRIADLEKEIRELRTFPDDSRQYAFVLPDAGVDLDQVERDLLAQAITRCDSNQTAAAKLLGITRYALRYRIEKYEGRLKKPRRRA